MRKDISNFIKRFNDIPYERKSIKRILWGFPDLDFYTKGMESGLSILQADTNMGKSILTSNVLSSASKQGYKSCVYASEHTNESYKRLIMQQNGKKGEFQAIPFTDGNWEKANIADIYVNENVVKSVTDGVGKDLLLFNSEQKDRDIDTILDWIEACNELGCKFCLIDNFMEVYNKSQDVFKGQEDMLTLLRDKLLALDMAGLLVMHINKESASNSFRLNVKSSRGTSTAGDKAYNVVSLYRKDCIFINKGQERILDNFKADCLKCGYNYDMCDGFLEVNKTKGNGNGIVGLKYNGESKTYTQAEKVTKTEADKLYTKTIQQESISKYHLEEIDEDLPF